MKAKFKDILKLPNFEFLKFKVNDIFYAINKCVKNISNKNEHALKLLNETSSLTHVINVDDEIEYDFMQAQAKIKLICAVCDATKEENWGNTFEATQVVINSVVKELTAFCKNYANIPMHTHECSKNNYGLLKAIGFKIEKVFWWSDN